MKTRNKTILVLLVLIMNMGFAQSTYLKITLSDKKNDYVSFPPNTKFELKDDTNKIVYSNKDTMKAFTVDKKYTLTVYPTWKKETDVFHLVDGKIEQIDTKYFNNPKKQKSKNYGYNDYDESTFTNGLSMKKTLEPSTLNPETYNAIFEFNNGITATYTDGEMLAVLDGKTLKIDGKYLIYSDYGLIKLSFRPKTGETWWVYEPNKN